MNNANPDIGIILKALEFAASKHSGQKRKDKDESPYINHPITLANILCNEAGITDENVLCAALLHDTIEDTETTYAKLLDLFGKTIADIVQEVTDNKLLPPEVRKAQHDMSTNWIEAWKRYVPSHQHYRFKGKVD